MHGICCHTWIKQFYFTDCPAGSFLNVTNNDECELCPKGSWNMGIDQNSCTSCTDGETTESPGATSGTQCSTYMLWNLFHSAMQYFLIMSFYFNIYQMM